MGDAEFEEDLVHKVDSQRVEVVDLRCPWWVDLRAATGSPEVAFTIALISGDVERRIAAAIRRQFHRLVYGCPGSLDLADNHARESGITEDLGSLRRVKLLLPLRS